MVDARTTGGEEDVPIVQVVITRASGGGYRLAVFDETHVLATKTCADYDEARRLIDAACRRLVQPSSAGRTMFMGAER